MNLSAFEPVDLHFELEAYSDVFAGKNNKTLRETLESSRYDKFRQAIRANYHERQDEPLGQFLLSLKQAGDMLYKQFLNKYGDLEYCTFSISDPHFLNGKGLYAFLREGEVVYFGRCRDSFKKRINQGYGKIHPKNCYLDGQATNCHINSLIQQHKRDVSFRVWSLMDDDEIEECEGDLIRAYQPEWNIALKDS